MADILYGGEDTKMDIDTTKERFDGIAAEYDAHRRFFGRAACALLLALAFLAPQCAFAAESVQIRLPNFTVTLNDQVVDNARRQYPFIVYRDITYVPLTYYDCRFLGLVSEWTKEAGLSVAQAAITGGYRDYAADKANPRVDSATVKTDAVRINGAAVSPSAAEYPFLSYRSVSYCPLTWQYCVDAFGWRYDFDDANGLRIDSTNPRVRRIDLEGATEDGAMLLRGEELFYATDGGAVYRVNTRDPAQRERILQLETGISDYIPYPEIRFSSHGGSRYLDYFSGHGGVMSHNFLYEILPDASLRERDLPIARRFGEIEIAINRTPMPIPLQIRVTEGGTERTLKASQYLATGLNSECDFFLQGRTLYLAAMPDDDTPARLYGLDIDSGELRSISDLPVRRFIADGRTIYIDGGGKLYGTDAEGGKAEFLADIFKPADASDTSAAAVPAGDALYYITPERTLRRLGGAGDLNDGAKLRAGGLIGLEGGYAAAVFEESPQTVARLMVFRGDACVLRSADAVKSPEASFFIPGSNVASDGARLAYRIGRTAYLVDLSARTPID